MSSRIDEYRGESKTLTVVRPAAPLPTPIANDELSLDMAATEQLDAFREVRTRLLAMGAAKSRTHFTTLVVGMTASTGASFVARNLAAVVHVAGTANCHAGRLQSAPPDAAPGAGCAPDEGGLFGYLEQPYVAVERLAHPTPIPVCSSSRRGAHRSSRASTSRRRT